VTDPHIAEVIQLEDQFAIVADGERGSAPRRVLKHGDTFGVFDLHGDVVTGDSGEQGLYHAGTRFLSRFELLLGKRRPLLLSSTIRDDNTMLAVDLTNSNVVRGDEQILSRGSLHIFRARTLWNGHAIERLRLSNHCRHPIQVPLTLHFDADFRDVFEVRGTQRERRGQRLPDDAIANGVVLRYQGLDRVERRTIVRWSRTPDRLESGSIGFSIVLAPQEVTEIEIEVACEVGEPLRTLHFADILERRVAAVAARESCECRVASSNESLTRWCIRSAADLRMMLTETPHGLFPYAGIPWFSTPFGRDGIITALETLWAVPDIARGVLEFLAATQATSHSEAQDAEPGKILHEMRSGEMAALGEIPFGKYYGSADATPLFVMLAVAYFERTADRDLIDRLWPNILAALGWMERFGDPDGDGLIEYARRSRTGLVQQGWKDSHDSVFHADGTLADAPIALCEIQGYAFRAWRGAAMLAKLRGDLHDSREWRMRAVRLRSHFDAAFWCDELGTYALALDGQKQRCRVRTSNAGHCLFSGIAMPKRAGTIVDGLMDPAMFSGWGVRTVAGGEARYNPMSYHNGSVWPHDNAIIASGFCRYGFTEAATRIMSAMLDLSQFVDAHRLPELICGFHRRGGESPTLYPVACVPQAWAAGTVYQLLAACLGLEIDAAAHRITFRRAMLPLSVDWIRLTNLSVGNATVDLLLTRHAYDVGVQVLRREGQVEILTVK
jgi:glycogen debranching enzyme